MTPRLDLQRCFGDIDIYLFDQLLKGRLAPGARVLDAGCGSGRNLVFLLRGGYDVCGVDESEEAVEHVRGLAAHLAPRLPPGNFRVERIEEMSFTDESFDFVICNAVLHFARDEEHWRRMVAEMWRVLAPGGVFFARLASTVGIEDRAERIEGRRYLLPGGIEWLLTDDEMLLDVTERLGGELIEPVKTTVVQGRRAMTTWCTRKLA